MVESIFTKSGQSTAGMIARLKVGKPVTIQTSTSLTSAENRLTDLLDLSPEAAKRVQAGRKVDAYLRLFQSFVQFLNGTRAANSKITPVSVEFVKLENPYAKKDERV